MEAEPETSPSHTDTPIPGTSGEPALTEVTGCQDCRERCGLEDGWEPGHLPSLSLRIQLSDLPGALRVSHNHPAPRRPRLLLCAQTEEEAVT